MGAGPCSGQQWSSGHSVTLVGKRTNSRFVGRGGPRAGQWSAVVKGSFCHFSR